MALGQWLRSTEHIKVVSLILLMILFPFLYFGWVLFASTDYSWWALALTLAGGTGIFSICVWLGKSAVVNKERFYSEECCVEIVWEDIEIWSILKPTELESADSGRILRYRLRSDDVTHQIGEYEIPKLGFNALLKVFRMYVAEKETTQRELIVVSGANLGPPQRPAAPGQPADSQE